MAWDYQQSKIDGLNKQIDNALDYTFGLYATCDLEPEVLKQILKGNEDEIN